jgi:Uma2 family endonuclease
VPTMVIAETSPTRENERLRLDGEERFVLCGVRWEFYERFVREFGDRGPRLTYDRGVMEMMVPSESHERLRRLVGRLIDVLTEELGIAIRSSGSVTTKRRKAERGFEPDESFYIASESKVRGRKRLNPAIHPPDLIVEIDITSSSLEKLEIFASFRIPEFWRYNGESLRVYHLSPVGRYVPCEQSRSFPFLPLAEVERFLGRRDETDETTWIRGFRRWVRQEIAPRWDKAANDSF